MKDKYNKLNPGKIEKKIRQGIAYVKGMFAEAGLYSNSDIKRLKELKDIHTGKKAFLIGNGPSVRLEDLEKLEAEVVFCFNRFYLAYDNTSFRPTYSLASDRQTISDFGQEIIEKSAGIIFIASVIRPAFKGNFVWICHQAGKLFRSPYRGIVPGGGTLVVAMQLAWHMGIRDFVLYGVDHNYSNIIPTGSKDLFYSASGEGNHFIPNYRSGKPWCPPHLESVERSFKECLNFITENGGSIVNATRGGKLEIFPRKFIEDYF
jgi:hypothetical protein